MRDKPYDCKYCPRSFFTREARDLHTRRHLPIVLDNWDYAEDSWNDAYQDI